MVRGVRLRALTLALALIMLGGGSVFYQAQVLQLPLAADEADEVWVVDARLSFHAHGDAPVKARMFIPSETERFTVLAENFIGTGYGFSVSEQERNRNVVWSAREASGDQTLYYRKTLSRRFGERTYREPDLRFRPHPALEGAEQEAATALLAPVSQRSADVQTFISEAVRKVNDTGDENVRLLLDGDFSVESRASVIELLLALAHIPAEQVHVLRMTESREQEPELWMRSFNGDEWIYFSPDEGVRALPEDRIIWWTGQQPLVEVSGGERPRVYFSIRRSEVNALELARGSPELREQTLLDFSLYELPVASQELYRIVLMIPLGVLLILVLRNMVGIETLGTFAPILVALAFRETQLVWGVVLFTTITVLGLSLRAWLEHLHLQLLSRLSVVLTFVVIAMAVISVVGHKLGLERGLSVALFPMVILTMIIERLSIVWEERGAGHAVKAGTGTLVAAVLGYWLMTRPALQYFVFTFPGTLLVLAGLMLLLGHYRGYRLSELLRFRDLASRSS